MHWIVHASVFSEVNRKLLIRALDRAELPYTVVLFANGEMTPDVDPAGPVYVCGAWNAKELAERRGWFPGSFLNENFSVEVWSDRLSGELLNDRVTYTTVEALQLERPMFVRPAEDTKAFDGAVFTPEAFDTLRENNSLRDIRVCVSPPRDIMREYRLFFVSGRVVTGSLYKRAGEIALSSDVDPEAITYAEAVADRWSPAPAFVMDVALASDRYWVVEFNNINSSGFYAADVSRYVEAIERSFGDNSGYSKQP